MVNGERETVHNVIRYSSLGELQPITGPNLELETRNLDLLSSVLCRLSSISASPFLPVTVSSCGPLSSAVFAYLARLASYCVPRALC